MPVMPTMNVRRILVPLDFGSDAEQALDNAMELAQPLQARLILIHVIAIPVVTEVNLSPYFAEMEIEAQQRMAAYKKKVADVGLSVDTVIVRGTPFREIVETAKTQQVDLIVIGTHGRTGVQHLLLGSVAERVVRLAPCPVLVSRETRYRTAA